MRTKNGDSKLMVLTYLLCMALFVNLAILKDPVDKGAIYMGLMICILITVAKVLMGKFYPNGDRFLFIFSCILSVIGIAVLYRLDSDVAVKQLVWVTAGIVIYMVIILTIPDMREFNRYKWVFMGITLVFMPLALVFGTEVNGSTNWILIAGTGFQPSEFGKIAFVLYLASALQSYEDKNNVIEDFKQLWEPALVVMFSLGCMVLQKDLGSALIFFGIAVTMLYVGTGKKKYVIISLVLFLAGAFVAYNLFGHVRQRVQIWRDPWSDPTGQGYQIVEGMYAISSGGLFGSGLGKGYPGFVPINTSDFIFAVICEELGIIVGLGVMIIYFLMFYRGMRSAFIIKDRFSQLNTVGFSSMIACQVLVIIGGVFAVIPLTGITLPLISYGGSSVITMFFSLAILQKISEEG
ncbi:FtsW/RodA/SpoVE family cell cycle protein [Clostridium sp. CTA-5]